VSGPAEPLAVLGIDAAWTAGRPDGIALLLHDGATARLLDVAPSAAAFCGAPRTAVPSWLEVVARAAALAGRRPDVVAVDMPLARGPITGRRAADDALARAFARCRLGVHSPTASRPGPVADRLHGAFEAMGYTLATVDTAPGTLPALIEVYPHAALLALLGVDRRVAYKLARARRYWPEADPAERRRRLRGEWERILRGLEDGIAGVCGRLDPHTGPMKAFEDMLDAVVCAWAGLRFAEGAARAFGDADAAIWVPDPRRAARACSGPPAGWSASGRSGRRAM